MAPASPRLLRGCCATCWGGGVRQCRPHRPGTFRLRHRGGRVPGRRVMLVRLKQPRRNGATLLSRPRSPRAAIGPGLPRCRPTAMPSIWSSCGSRAGNGGRPGSGAGRSGGHNVPEAVVRRRYRRGMENFFASTGRAQISGGSWTIRGQEGPNLIACGARGAPDDVSDSAAWTKLTGEFR